MGKFGMASGNTPAKIWQRSCITCLTRMETLAVRSQGSEVTYLFSILMCAKMYSSIDRCTLACFHMHIPNTDYQSFESRKASRFWILMHFRWSRFSPSHEAESKAAHNDVSYRLLRPALARQFNEILLQTGK